MDAPSTTPVPQNTDAPSTTTMFQADDAASTTILPATTPIPETQTAVENYETTISFKLNSDMSQITDAVTSAIRINLSVKLNIDIIHISALSFEQIRISTRRLLEVRASLTVTSSSLAASQTINTMLSRDVFNSVLATSSNNVLVATDFEVVTTKVGGSTQDSKMSDTTIFLLIIGCVGVVLVTVFIIISAVMCKKSPTAPTRYYPLDINHDAPIYSPT